MWDPHTHTRHHLNVGQKLEIDEKNMKSTTEKMNLDSCRTCRELEIVKFFAHE